MNSHMECVRVTVPAADEEAQALGNMEFVRRMRSLVQWAEPGRPVTQTGAMRRGDTTSWMRHFGLRAPSELGPPSMWDIRGIGQPWDIAIETGMLSLTNTKVRPGPTGTVFESDDPVAQVHLGRSIVNLLAPACTLALPHGRNRGAADQHDHAGVVRAAVPAGGP